VSVCPAGDFIVGGLTEQDEREDQTEPSIRIEGGYLNEPAHRPTLSRRATAKVGSKLARASRLLSDPDF
jgi:hypothetical protein